MSAVRGSAIERDFPLDQLVNVVLADHSGKWRVECTDDWCYVRPVGVPTRTQGWKLHLSATPLSAPVVLVAAAQVLVAAGCQFKFAPTLARVHEMAGARVDRGSGGKFITAYPADDEQFRLLAERLDAATRGLPGPAILSDRRYGPGSLVHYRYGAFTGVTRLGNDGSYESLLTAPDGALVPDRRRAWFAPPGWANSPFPDQPTGARAKPRAVLLHDRYEVRRAIQHANKGGVFQARDRLTGLDVVVKQARPHTQAALTGTDGRDILRHEARMLSRLADTGLVPRLIELFPQGTDLFLAEEHLPGTPLRAWVTGQQWSNQGLVPADRALTVARRLVGLVARVHDHGLVLRDLSPNNLLIGDDLNVRLVDLEHAAEAGEPVRLAYTPGYGAPEVAGSEWYAPAPAPAADCYSLGATLLHLATGVDPVFLPDWPAARSDGQRLAALTEALRPHTPALTVLADVIIGLTRTDFGQRLDLSGAARLLRPPATAAEPGPSATNTDDDPAANAPTSTRAQDEPTVDEMLDAGLRYLDGLITLDSEREVSRSGPFGSTTDRCAVQHGAAGLLAVLTRAARVGVGGISPDRVAALAGWIRQQLPREPRLLPGLYFGRSGVAWALADAAVLLADASIAADAADLARRVPLRWPNPDVCHGAAGAGLAQVRLHQLDPDGGFAGRVATCADGLAEAVDRVGPEVWWPVPTDFDSVLAGSASPGFAHGVAGVATFLLTAAELTGERRYLDLAVAAGKTLAGRAIVDGPSAWWPTDRTETSPVRRHLSAHWCTGASGIGTFLLRLWRATGVEEYRQLAEAAAETAWQARWTATPTQCHGTAGDGELLLDLAAATGDRRYTRRAAELAEVMRTRVAFRAGGMAFPDESAGSVVADFQTGQAGTLAFLLRLRHGGPRLWMADPVDDGAARRPLAAAGTPAVAP